MHSWRKTTILATAFCLYIALGAVVFVHLEQTDGADRRRRFRLSLAEFVGNHSRCGVTTESLEALMGHLDTVHGHAGFLPKADPSPGAPLPDPWAIMNGVVFCYSIVSTIGFGWVSPYSIGSQVFCVLYAVPGIALHGYVLLVIGKTCKLAFAAGHRLLFASCTRAPSTRRRTPEAAMAAAVAVTLEVILLVLPAALFVHMEGWSFVAALYFNFVCLSSIGFGDMKPTHAAVPLADRVFLKEVAYRIGVLVYLMVSLTVLTVSLAGLWQHQRSKMLTRLYGNTCSEARDRERASGRRHDEEDNADIVMERHQATEDDVHVQ